MAWVPEKIELTRATQTDGTIRWTTTNLRSYMPGTKDLVAILDQFDVPPEWGKARIRKTYGDAITGISNQRLADAIRWRKTVRTTLADQFSDPFADRSADHLRTTQQTPGQTVRTSLADQADQ